MKINLTVFLNCQVSYLMKKIIPLIAALFFLTGCSRAGTPPPTPFPEGYLPTAVALTAAALPSPTLVIIPPTSTATPTFTPSPSPSPTATFPPTAAPKAPIPAIHVLSPGPMSKVISPITLKTYVQPGAKGQIQVELLGEDGRLLARDLFRRETILVEGAYIKMEIPFETRAAAELGRLQISTKDEFGRPLEVYSIHLLLLSVGRYDINRSDTEHPRSIFFFPESEQEFSGGTLPVIGEYQSYNDNSVILELLDEEGKVLGLRVLNLTAGERESFETSIEYKVKEQVSARLILRQSDDKFNGAVYLHSQIVILNP